MAADYFCVYCLQHKEVKHFSEWIDSNKTSARKCDDCHDIAKVREILINNAKSREVRKQQDELARKTVAMRESESKQGAIKRNIRKAMDDLAELKAANEFDI